MDATRLTAARADYSAVVLNATKASVKLGVIVDGEVQVVREVEC